MKTNQKKVLLVLLGLYLVIAIIAFVISNNKKEKDKEPIQNGVIKEKRFGKVESYSEFFKINATINDNAMMNTSYTATEIYFNVKNENTYYFIKCNKIGNNIYEKDYYLLLVLNNNNGFYELKEINDSIYSLESYAKNYSGYISVSSNKKLISSEFYDDSVLTIYLEYFKNMLIYDPELAYSMLAEDTKLNYINFEDFQSKAFEIYNILSSKIFSYNLDEDVEVGEKTYYLEDNNRNKIIIFEEDIMNFKISY